MDKDPHSPVDYAKGVLTEDLKVLSMRLTDEDTAAATFFISILYQLQACASEVNLAQLFFDLSTAAFQGFHIEGESVAIVDRVLQHAERIAHTLSADASQRH